MCLAVYSADHGYDEPANSDNCLRSTLSAKVVLFKLRRGRGARSAEPPSPAGAND
jgi:hypothetical protein